MIADMNTSLMRGCPVHSTARPHLIVRGHQDGLHRTKQAQIRLSGVEPHLRARRLKDFIFLDTEVTSGDMSPLLSHPALSYVAFTKKRHFSHSMDQVNASKNAPASRGSKRES